jgi:hypothetical protein
VNRFYVENNLPDLLLPNLIIGEGVADVAFLDALLTHRGIRDRCHLGFPDGPKKGKDGFGDYLLGLRIKLERSTSRVQKVLIITDSDDDPAAAFESVCEHVNAANAALTIERHYPVPETVRLLSPGTPSLAVATLPFDEQGCLETLLVAAADDGSHALHDCFEAYWPCVRFDRNRKSVESKQKLTTIIAASNINNPSCSLGVIWSGEQRRWNPMSINHVAFQFFGDFLVAFAA